MKKIFFIVLILGITSCRKDLTETDYDELIGKYKLVYTLRFSTSTYDKLVPSDNYEIDFNNKGKVYTYKNGHCESKEKVEDCHAVIYSPSMNKDVHLYLKNKAGAVQMTFLNYSNSYDTLVIDGYFPFENDPNHNPYHYGHYYVKE
jgi:hypothetical protein